MKKIMFNDKYGLTNAVLKGRKTMTRRMCLDYDTGAIMTQDYKSVLYQPSYNRIQCYTERGPIHYSKDAAYKIGEVVAVAQSYECMANDGYLNRMMETSSTFKKEYCGAGWNNKMFVRADLMPHQIRITNIKVERLQDINDEDCIKEGIYVNPNPPKWREYDPYEPWHPNVKPYKFTTIKGFCKPQFAFAFLIDAISGKGTWKRNPFVFAYSFELIK